MVFNKMTSFNLPKLQFKFIGNACGIFIGSRGTKILCDPWIINGVFEGSWFHYPKLNSTLSDFDDINAVYLSHIHQDHFDDRNFNFNKSIPIIVLDHEPNFLIKKLVSLGFKNLIKIKNLETRKFNEFNLTMFAPFCKHNFYHAVIGNIIDSALLIDCNGITALNSNDNTLSVESAKMIRNKFGKLNLAMLNYNSAGPYPSCFDNLTEDEKISEHHRIIQRNFSHLKKIIEILEPYNVLPFAGSYVLAGSSYHKNKYLGTSTWDDCVSWLSKNYNGDTKAVLLRENDIFNLETSSANNKYIPIDLVDMKDYIEKELAFIQYPYQKEVFPNENELIECLEIAANKMKNRMKNYGISTNFNIIINLFKTNFLIYPNFQKNCSINKYDKRLVCYLDERLLNNIVRRKSNWNNAEIGGHIKMNRMPNIYEPDLHIGLQFLHM